MKQIKQISAEDRKRLDRQRFIGLQTQRKLMNSLILITPLNGVNTQLAKNLVLAGVNISVYDQQKITDDDFQTNFLVASNDIGKNRGQTILSKLKQMNESGKYDLINQNIYQKIQTDPKYFEKFTIITTSITSFQQVQKWDLLAHKINRPYYNLVSCGLYGFSYISLGSQFKYTRQVRKTISIDINGKTSDNYLDFQDVILTSLKFENQFNQKQKNKKQLYYAILMMKNAEIKGLKYNPFIKTQQNEKTLNEIVDYAIQLRGNANKQFYTKFAIQYGLQYCPVYSVLGSVISQQYIKVISGQHEPGMNWFIYDSQACYGHITRLAAQNKDYEKIYLREDLRVKRT